ncbi:MAG: hypothetical protein HY542_00515 [Deltaproteobacteria bacterium]|nr:hypothetical protein [Deltaproteobacteria bacterium]
MVTLTQQDPYERHIIYRQVFGAAALAASSVASCVGQYRFALSAYEQSPGLGIFGEAPSFTRSFYSPTNPVGRFFRSSFGGLNPRTTSAGLSEAIHQSAMPFATATSCGYILSQGLRLYGNVGMICPSSGDHRSSAPWLEKSIVIGDTASVLLAIVKSFHFLLGAKKAIQAPSLASILNFQRAQRFVALSSVGYAVTAVLKLVREFLRPRDKPPESPNLSTVIYSTMDVANGAAGAFGAAYFLSLSRSFAARGMFIEAQRAALGISKWNGAAQLSGRILPALSGIFAIAISACNYLKADNQKKRTSSEIGIGIGILTLPASYFALPATGFISALFMTPMLGLGIWQTSIDYPKS